jgi:hypothetical protein
MTGPGFPRTEKVDIDMDLHDEADSDLALEEFDFPETLSPDVLKHPEVQEDEENEEKDDAGMDSHDETPSNLASAVLNTTQHVEDQKKEENEEKSDAVARSDTQTSTASKNKLLEGDKDIDSQIVDDFISEEESRKKGEDLYLG